MQVAETVHLYDVLRLFFKHISRWKVFDVSMHQSEDLKTKYDKIDYSIFVTIPK